MAPPDSYSYSRYLNAKRTVDERALNQRVWRNFLSVLSDSPNSPIKIVEVGGGVGTTAERIFAALETRPVDGVDYTLVDVRPENLETARKQLVDWGRRSGYRLEEEGTNSLILEKESSFFRIRFVLEDLFEFAKKSSPSSCDAIIAQAVFDLLDIQRALNTLRPLLAPRGVWYLPIHFDGLTAFEPVIDSGLDQKIERLYHRSMSDPTGEEGGGREGASTGRKLLSHFQSYGHALLEAGSSDWIVFAQGDEYPGDEAYFLYHILHFIESELSGHPELDGKTFEKWIARRRNQIEDGTLIYIAHQLDVLARRGDRSNSDYPS